MKKILKKLSILTLAVLATAVINHGQNCNTPGCLDSTFGMGSGWTKTPIPANLAATPPKGAVQQADGKILSLIMALNGSPFTDAIIRYNHDGSLDTSFGTGGIVYVNWLGGHAYAIAVQTIGNEERIVLAGTGTGRTSSLRVDRLRPNGSPDTDFGVNGTVNYAIGYAEAIAIQPDGKILTMGPAGALVRLNDKGMLDTTFGNGGVIQSNSWRVLSIALQPDGRIVAAGYWTNAKGVNSMSVWRFNSNGSPDDGRRSDLTKGDSFGKGGQTIIDSLNPARDVKIDAAGRIVIAGSALAYRDFAVVRLTTTGQLDPSFGAGGIATVDFNGSYEEARSVMFRSNGQIILTGFTNTALAIGPGLVRLNSNGWIDYSVVSDFSSEGEAGGHGLIQFDPGCFCEKVIQFGTMTNLGSYYAIAARYLP